MRFDHVAGLLPIDEISGLVLSLKLISGSAVLAIATVFTTATVPWGLLIW